MERQLEREQTVLDRNNSRPQFAANRALKTGASAVAVDKEPRIEIQTDWDHQVPLEAELQQVAILNG